MKLLNVMMAKELLDLQIEQMSLLLEELSLRRKVMDLDLKLGLCTQDWYNRKDTMLNCKHAVYTDLLEDYRMTQTVIAKLEQQDSENIEAQRLLEVAKVAGEVLVDETSFVGDDDHKKEEDYTDASYEVVEREESEHFVLHKAEADNELDEKKDTTKKK